MEMDQLPAQHWAPFADDTCTKNHTQQPINVLIICIFVRHSFYGHLDFSPPLIYNPDRKIQLHPCNIIQGTFTVTYFP